MRTDSWVDVKANSAKLNVTDEARLGRALRSASVEIPAAAQVVEVRELAAPAINIFAGVRLVNNAGGYCTSGFSVYDRYGNRGVTTAAHCNNALSYGGRALTYVNERYGGSYDIQWHYRRDLTVQPRFFTGPGTRPVEGSKGRSAQQVGEYVCKYGQRTGYGCANIMGKGFDLSYIPNSNNTFIGVYRKKPADPIILPGDSGGPWFLVNDAYGITSGTSESPNYHFGYYTAIDYVPGIGVQLLKSG